MGRGAGLGRWLTTPVLVAVLVLAGLRAAHPAAAQVSRDEAGVARAKADALALLLNRARVREGLKPLARSPALDRAAQDHSRDMAQRSYLEHTAPDGTQSIDRAIRAGYGARKGTGWRVTEVISAISGDPAGPLGWWLNDSPEVHGTVLRDPRWREMGVGYAAGGEYGNYWTVLVGCQPGVLPSVEVDGRTYQHAEECDQSEPPLAASPTPIAVRKPRAVAAARAEPAGDAQVEVRWEGLTDLRPADWMGLFRVGEPDARYAAWLYLDCITTPVVAAPEMGSCSLPVPVGLPAGDYEVRLFRDGGFVELARSERFGLRPRLAVEVSITSPAVRPGERLHVAWTGLASATPRDWLGLYPADRPERPAAAWTYVSCSTIPDGARSQGSCDLVVPSDAEPGRYVVRFFRDDALAPTGSSSVSVLTPDRTSGGAG